MAVVDSEFCLVCCSDVRAWGHSMSCPVDPKYPKEPKTNDSLTIATIDGLVTRAHQNAIAHGFYEAEEAIAAILQNQPELDPEQARQLRLAFRNLNLKSKLFGITTEPAEAGRELRKPDMIAFLEELSDIVIRVFDLAGDASTGLVDPSTGEPVRASFGEILARKMAYNETRPKYHGHSVGSA